MLDAMSAPAASTDPGNKMLHSQHGASQAAHIPTDNGSMRDNQLMAALPGPASTLLPEMEMHSVSVHSVAAPMYLLVDMTRIAVTF
jgi:hypothetical protein